MILSIHEQFFLFFLSILIGVIGGLVYGIICIFRKYIVHNIIGIYIEDLLFWCVFAVCFFITMLYFNYADIRPYMFLGLFIGLTLYGILLHKLTIKILHPFIMLLRLFAEIILTPIMLMLFPFFKLFDYFKKLLKNTRKCERIKHSIWKKCNFFKKR